MVYQKVFKAIFLERPNRFIAWVELNGKKELCHVKNTGRCRELLIPGVMVYVQESENLNRKTKYDLIAVRKGERLVNIDSQAPNLAVGEFLPQLFPDGTLFRAETFYKTSRFDYYIETPNKRIFLEVKGITLEENGVVLFPDAPTERGVKHLRELMDCMKDGYDAYILFVIQMKNVLCFKPNDQTHPAFGDTLRLAAQAGVHLLAWDCLVTKNSMTLADPVKICLDRTGEEHL